MVKIVPIKSGIFEKTENKHRYSYSFVQGVEIQVPEHLKEELKKKGFIGQPIKKTKIDKKEN